MTQEDYNKIKPQVLDIARELSPAWHFALLERFRRELGVSLEGSCEVLCRLIDDGSVVLSKRQLFEIKE